MQLTGELKEKVEKAETKEEAKQTIENAGMILDDAELDQVAGGLPRKIVFCNPLLEKVAK
jgi:hypothetical protein